MEMGTGNGNGMGNNGDACDGVKYLYRLMYEIGWIREMDGCMAICMARSRKRRIIRMHDNDMTTTRHDMIHKPLSSGQVTTSVKKDVKGK
jgi:hypothetical protein